MSKYRTSLPGIDPASLRAQAKTHLKALRHAVAADGAPSREALAVANRLCGLRSFQDLSARELLQRAGQVRLKHMLALLAEENGFSSWTEAVRSYEAPQARRPSLIDQSDSMYEAGISGLMNRWFADYHEAVASLSELGGYLLPYRNQYYITERAGIEVLGLDPDDADWVAIGHNWVEPAERQAWERLAEKRAAVRALKS